MALTFPGLGGLLNAPGMSKREAREAEAKRLADAQKIDRDRFEFERFQLQQNAPFMREMMQQDAAQAKLTTEQQQRDLQQSKNAEFNKQFGTMRANAAKRRPQTLGLPQGAFESSQPVRARLASRRVQQADFDPNASLRNQVEANELRKQLRGPAPGYGPTAQRLAEGRAAQAARPRSSASRGSSGGGGAAAPSRPPGGSVFDRPHPGGIGQSAGASTGAGGAQPSLGAAARRRPGAAAPTWTPQPGTQGQAPRGASPMLPNPVLGGGSWNAQPWAADVYSRNNRPSDLAAVGTVGDLAGRTGEMTVHSSNPNAGRSNTLGYNSRGESTTSSGPGPRRQSRNNSGRGR